MNKIIPNLFLGSVQASFDKEVLQHNNITHILVVGDLLEKLHPNDFKYHQISVDDVSWVDLISHFPICVQFINEGINSGGVLVHCRAGISRSSTIVIAYLMAQNKWEYEKAFKFTKSKRECIWPNDGFCQQLKLYEKMNFTVNSEHPDLIQFLKDLKDKVEQIHETIKLQNQIRRRRAEENAQKQEIQ